MGDKWTLLLVTLLFWNNVDDGFQFHSPCEPIIFDNKQNADTTHTRIYIPLHHAGETPLAKQKIQKLWNDIDEIVF